MSKSLIAVAFLVFSMLGLVACGESSQEKATKQVCSATSEISAQIKKLETLPISSSFPTEAKASVEAIDKSIKQINEAAPNLPTASKEEINAADKAFETEIAVITTSVASASKSSNIEAALKSAENPRESRPRLASLAPTTRKRSKPSNAHRLRIGQR